MIPIGLLVVALAACGGSAKTSSASSGKTTASPDESSAAVAPGEVAIKVDPCSLVTMADAQAVLGGTLEVNTHQDPDQYECVYSSSDGVDSILVRELDGSAVNVLRTGLPNVTGDLRADVGDGGVFGEHGGNIQFLTAGGGIFIGGATNDGSLDHATLLGLAEKAAGRVA
jgi:hypothetical protein